MTTDFQITTGREIWGRSAGVTQVTECLSAAALPNSRILVNRISRSKKS